MSRLYCFFRPQIRVGFQWFCDLRVHHRERIPAAGPMLLASNHASYLDPALLGGVLVQRELHFMARSTLFRNPFFGGLIRRTNAHPIERGKGPDQDWDSFLNVLGEGKALLVFPEGTRTLTGELQPGKSGFGKLAHMSRVPVYPAYIHGTYQMWPKGGKFKFAPVRVYFGNAVPLEDLLGLPPEKRVLRQISSRVMEAIAELKKEAEAGQTGSEPGSGKFRAAAR